MTDLSPAPDPRTLTEHPQVTNSLASDHDGRTRNELTCPECGRIVPQSHGYVTTCPCGINLACWGNSMYHWPARLDIAAPAVTNMPKGVPPHHQPEADAVYGNIGGSDILLTPLTQEAYEALLKADLDMPQGGADWTGTYPTIRLNAPTLTNTMYNPGLRNRYRRAMNALAHLRLRHDGSGGPNPYSIGNPDAIWR